LCDPRGCTLGLGLCSARRPTAGRSHHVGPGRNPLCGLGNSGGPQGMEKHGAGTRMIPWLDGAIPYVKALHIAALTIWCAGLFALPLMLARHDPAIGQADYSRIRVASHYGYAWGVTPAALVAIAA